MTLTSGRGVWAWWAPVAGAGVSFGASGGCGQVLEVSCGGGAGGVCDRAMPTAQSCNMSAEQLLSRINRLLRIDISTPQHRWPSTIGDRAHRGMPRIEAFKIDVRRWEVRAPKTARAVMPPIRRLASRRFASRPTTVGRARRGASAGMSEPARWISAQIGQQWSPGGHRRDVREATRGRVRRPAPATAATAEACARRNALEMHVAERQDELQRQRKQRQACTPPPTRPKPAHRRYAYASRQRHGRRGQ